MTRRPATAGLPLLTALLLATACSGGGDETVRTATSPTPSAGGSATALVVEGTAGPGSAPVRATLTCEPPGGDHPQAEQACADLSRTSEPFAPLPSDVGCAEVYGGPQTATVSGTYRGEPVRLELSRTDACRAGQWDDLGALLSALLPAGA